MPTPILIFIDICSLRWSYF